MVLSGAVQGTQRHSGAFKAQGGNTRFRAVFPFGIKDLTLKKDDFLKNGERAYYEKEKSVLRKLFLSHFKALGGGPSLRAFQSHSAFLELTR